MDIVQCSKHDLGQYFTTNNKLQEKVLEFILNDTSNILEPSIGRGDLIKAIKNKKSKVIFDMYEIDTKIKLLDEIEKEKVIYGDFMNQEITKTYKTIVGNPPFVRTKKGNLYIDFTEKCFNLLEDNGELIFIVPSDFFKLTCASNLLNKMASCGTFTHVFQPHDESMFENASIDVMVFRYCKALHPTEVEKRVLYNGKLRYMINNKGLITFHEKENTSTVVFKDQFDIYVGLVSGKERVYKNEALGNVEILNGEGKLHKYIFIDSFPCQNEDVNNYLLQHKTDLTERKIRKFNESNWFEWGAPRNITSVNKNIGKECLYLYNLTRQQKVSFAGKVNYFGGGLIMLLPKKMTPLSPRCNLSKVVAYLNSDEFKNNFMFSGRFKIGHRQISNSYIPLKCFKQSCL